MHCCSCCSDMASYIINQSFYFINFELIMRRNFSLIAHLLVVKSLVTHYKVCSLLLVEFACCKNHLPIVAKFARYSLQKFLVAESHLLCNIPSLLVAEVARCKKSVVTRWEILLLLIAINHLLLVAEVTSCKKSFVTC